MHIPPYYKRREWQWLLTGVVVGAIIAYIFFLFIHGRIYERITEESIDLQTELTQLESKYEGLLESQEQEEEQKTDIQQIQELEVAFINDDRLEVDRLTKHQLEAMVKDELQSIIGKQIEDLAQNPDLVISVIENKRFKIDDVNYLLEVRFLALAPQTRLRIMIAIDH
ncbi:sporulation membrane protein YtrI [Thalassobacillus sp. CUG 92003]|uniref:sporulation membrane protein YtrI n=1 Tax=Thalassobacillus sp. CUG 92003 TaxID=2736641 RepID=UPI0015E78212|nr:sporulation membrane protein YtrI [Thalassobacillus sp. CUG 92003]